MAITDKGTSDGSRKPLCPKMKKKNLCNRPKDKCTRFESNSSQNVSHQINIHEMGPLCESRVKSSAIHSESEEDDDYGDFLKHFSKEVRSDDDTCLWLSSGSLSPPKSCSHDYELSGLLDFTSVDGSRVDPIKEASLVLGDQKISDDDQMIIQDSLIEDEVVTWLVRLIESESSDSCFSCSDFSTPCSNSDYASSEVFDLDDFGNDKQLFWPSDWKSDMGSEGQWEFFIMSPRKSICNEGFPERKTSPESLRLRVHKGKMMNVQEKECKRRLFFGTGSKSARFVELKCSSKGNKEVRRVSSMPSRLKKLSKNCVKIVPLDLEDEPAKAVVFEKQATEYKQLWGEDFEEELPIETMLGLDEFDGHEGVESEFNKDDFSLGESL